MMNSRPLRPNHQSKPPSRWSYHQNSRDFVGWVNKLGIERTLAGRMANFLDTKFNLRRIALLFLFSLALSFFISWDPEVSFTNYKEGDVAASLIKSPLSFEVVDHERTQSKRLEAEESVPAVYDYDLGLYDLLISRVHGAFKNMRAYPIPNHLPLAKFQDLQSDFESELGGIHVSKESFEWLTKEKFRSAIENDVVQNLSRWSNQKILEEAGPLRLSSHHRISINVMEQGSKGEEFLIDPSRLADKNEIRKRLDYQSVITSLKESSDKIQMTDFLRSFIVPNLTINKQETESRKQRARDLISSVVVPVKKGEIVIREGETFQRIHVSILDELRRLQATRHQDFVSLMTAIFFVALLLTFWGYLSRFMSKVKISTKDAVAMGSIVFLVLVMSKFTLFLASTALIEHFSYIPVSFYSYIIPVSAGAMMVGLMIPYGEVVWLFSMFLAITLGFLLDRNFTFMIVTFASGIVAARGVYGCKKREDLYWAGIKTGLMNAVLIFCVTLMGKTTPAVLRHELIWNVPAGFLSGLLASLVALTLIPLWENLFVYTTDIKLLELSNLNHPLLKEMIVKAPGTYHHSLVVGTMCEAAAEAIGANPLLAKVCGYYHDIGKTNHAIYFIENQKPGENRHDHISAGMSKTILIAHVKDGVEMGLKYKLGRQIIDVIEQHHGTTLISFFYHRAKENEDTDMHEVTEDEYRYPGRKPEFREAALCMLGDSIEAAARTLDEPTPARLQNIVHNIVRKKFLDGQLDNCSLTLRDLSVIESSFSKILFGIYHQRIDYPTSAKPTLSKPYEQTVS